MSVELEAFIETLVDVTVVPTNQCRLFFINELPE